VIDRYSHPAWRIGASAFLIVSAFVALAPILWIVGLALRTGADVYSRSILPKALRPENFLDAWDQFGMGVLFLNSILVTVASVVVAVVLSVLAAYGFARLRFRGSEVLFLLILLGLMIPPAALIIPLFVEIRTMGLYDTHIGLSLVYVAFGLPLSILVLRSFFAAIPKELLEAARIDGASEWRLFFKVVLPLGLPAIAALAIFQVLFVWNDLLIGLTLAQENTPIAPTIAQQLRRFGSNLDVIAPASFFSAVVPLTIFALFQRYFVQGLLAGSVK
jgi:alpha-glucoside transport system permease protein